MKTFLYSLALLASVSACGSEASGTDAPTDGPGDPSSSDPAPVDETASDDPAGIVASSSLGVAPECEATTSTVGLDTATSLGSANDVLAVIADSSTGTFSYGDGTTSTFSLDVTPDGSTAEIAEVAASDACGAYSTMNLSVTVRFSTDDGAFDESFGGMILAMANADGAMDGLELVGDPLDATSLGGTYESSTGEISEGSVYLNAFFDGLRPTPVDDETQEPEMVNGYVALSGDVASDACAGGADCLTQSVRELVGSFLFD